MRDLTAALAEARAAAVVEVVDVDLGPGTRRAGPADADAVFALTVELARTHTPERGAFDRWFPGLCARPESLVAVADDGGGVLGSLVAHVYPALHANGPLAWIEEVVVDPAARRRGLGRRLLVAAERWAAAQGAASVSLATGRAGDFYLALGYPPAATYYRKAL